jgi:predicted dehydrogenase
LKILVIGSGSIGQRHIKNLKSLGINNIEVFDNDKKILKSVEKKFKIKSQNKLNFNKIDCTLICTPPNSHTKLTKLALEDNSNVFIEKPLSNSLKDINVISKLAKKKSLKIFVGYVFRFDKGLLKINEFLKKDKIGDVVSYDAYEGWHLSNWRPWQNFEKSYTSSKNMGGGIILDGSHELNYLQWIGGQIDYVFSFYQKIPKMKVETEGISEILTQFNSKAIGRIHLDFINPKYNRHCEILGNDGSINWSYENLSFTIQKIDGTKKLVKYENDPNRMYVDEMQHVIKCINDEELNRISLEDAKKTLAISLSIKESGRQKKAIKITKNKSDLF